MSLTLFVYLRRCIVLLIISLRFAYTFAETSSTATTKSAVAVIHVSYVTSLFT